MPIIDVAFVIILSGFVFYGLFFGLIRAIGLLLGIFAGAWVAGHYYLLVFSYVSGMFMGRDGLGKVLVFLFVFSLVQKLVMITISLLDKLFGLISIIPFLKTINRVAGAILGFAEGSLIIGMVIYISARYTLIEHWLGSSLVSSKLAPFFLKFANIIVPLLPDFLKQLKSLI